MRALVIYDTTGKIYYIGYGDTEAPKGLKHIFVEVPDGMQLLRIDPATDQPIFVDTTSVSQIDAKLKEMSDTIDEILVSALT